MVIFRQCQFSFHINCHGFFLQIDRQTGLKLQEEIEKRRKDEQMMGAAKLMEQIHENEQDRLFELERKDQENIQMQKSVHLQPFSFMNKSLET